MAIKFWAFLRILHRLEKNSLRLWAIFIWNRLHIGWDLTLPVQPVSKWIWRFQNVWIFKVLNLIFSYHRGTLLGLNKNFIMILKRLLVVKASKVFKNVISCFLAMFGYFIIKLISALPQQIQLWWNVFAFFFTVHIFVRNTWQVVNNAIRSIQIILKFDEFFFAHHPRVHQFFTSNSLIVVLENIWE